MDPRRGLDSPVDTSADGGTGQIVAGDEQTGPASLESVECRNADAVAELVLGQATRPLPYPGHDRIAACAQEIAELGLGRSDQFLRRGQRRLRRPGTANVTG